MGSGYHRPGWLAAPAAPWCQRWFILAGRRKKLAYSLIDGGILIETWPRVKTFRCPAPPTATSTPSGRRTAHQIVFNRGMGIFPISSSSTWMARTCARSPGGVQEWPVGWAGGWQFPLHRAGPGVRVHRLPPRPRQRRKPGVLERTSNPSHPMASTWLSPGWPSVSAGRSISSRLDGADRWALANDSLWVLNPLWSASGGGCWHCLGHRLGFSGALINLRTCGSLPAARRQPPRLEAVRFPFSPGVGAAVGVLRPPLFDSGGVCDMIPSCQSNPFLSPN